MDVVLHWVSADGVLLYALIFMGGLGLPVPVTPILLLLGAGLAGGEVSPVAGAILPPLLLCLGDTVWYFIGKKYGAGVLRSVCKISFERDSCVQRTQNAFHRFGVRVMLFSRFVPGLSTLAAPMAGADGERLPRFVFFDLGGVTIFCGVFMLIGYSFANQLGRVLDLLSAISGNATTLGVIALLGYVAYKFSARRWMMRQSEQLAINASDAQSRLKTDPKILIADLRGPIDLANDPFTVPGAKRMTETKLFALVQDMPTTSTIFLFCNCPNQASSTHVALELRRMGFKNAHPIRDGLDGWRSAKLPVEAAAPTEAPSACAATP